MRTLPATSLNSRRLTNPFCRAKTIAILAVAEEREKIPVDPVPTAVKEHLNAQDPVATE
jgi:hypothetical protein